MILLFDYIGYKRLSENGQLFKNFTGPLGQLFFFLSRSLDVNGEHSAISPKVASLYQRWLGKRLFSDKRL
jgi:hypothetical protein